MPTTHYRKILPIHWQERRSWKKAWELRQEDRSTFCVGDYLILQEWDPALEYTGCHGYTRNEEVCRIDLVLRGCNGIEPGWAILSTTTIHVHRRLDATRLTMEGRLIDDDELGTEPVESVDLRDVLRIIREHNEAAEQAVPVANRSRSERDHFKLACAKHIPKSLPDAMGPEETAQEIQKANHAASIVDDCAQAIAYPRLNEKVREAVIRMQFHTLFQRTREVLDLEARLAKAEDERNAWRAGHQERTNEADVLRAEVARLKRQRLILTAWMRMFRASLFQWASIRPGLHRQIQEIAKSWNNHPRHGAAWLKSKEGGA